MKRLKRFKRLKRLKRLKVGTNNHTTSEPHTHVMSNENKFPLKRLEKVGKGWKRLKKVAVP